MPISEPIYQGIRDRHMLEALDEPWGIDCEADSHHTLNEYTRNHAGPAAYWASGPCEKSTGFRCARLVEYAQAHAEAGLSYSCTYCGHVHRWADSVFTPIKGQS